MDGRLAKSAIHLEERLPRDIRQLYLRVVDESLGVVFPRPKKKRENRVHDFHLTIFGARFKAFINNVLKYLQVVHGTLLWKVGLPPPIPPLVQPRQTPLPPLGAPLHLSPSAVYTNPGPQLAMSPKAHQCLDSRIKLLETFAFHPAQPTLSRASESLTFYLRPTTFLSLPHAFLVSRVHSAPAQTIQPKLWPRAHSHHHTAVHNFGRVQMVKAKKVDFF
ncbi:uncharacterized protein PGTG_05888 [Puccinia graminis f. sp. tritici CRL 75-36-700-3]|uniref:Uncharacterized protein n=1 Tax=Puccinia graminis f. sp. tritici (strain CRL 75-36-700-3 / race SCCL) TaxID=418459 RepID=E3K5Z6_PUCGT|nr:uncharacterized protein PGTG_05888 [Puccinia graminis f. sp. tritici CRL 75-36-700-3]EFP79567.1 hypothetical protein PGTG_05888 [Puccinia graminis f. sp. tritici CRL 75-36-700-3]